MFVAPKTDILDDLQTWPAVPGKKKVIIFLTRNQEFSSMLVFFLFLPELQTSPTMFLVPKSGILGQILKQSIEHS